MDTGLTVSALAAFMEAYSTFCKPICREFGIPQTAFDILMFLANNPQYGTAREISRLRGLKENIISINVNKLVNDGYIERSADAKDRRKVHLKCTEKAAEIIESGRRMQESFLQEMQQGLTPQEKQLHRHCLETIAANSKRILEKKRG